MVVYIHDANAILSVPLKNRAKTSLINAYNKVNDVFTACGIQPNLQISDNECSVAFKRFLRKRNITLQLVPPYDHHTNPAERAIYRFKSNFITGLSSLPPLFPLHL